jgi:hypothetical protein
MPRHDLSDGLAIPGRGRFLSFADRSVISTIRLGVLFVMAFWSGSSRQTFARLKEVVSRLDPDGRLEVVVVDTDGFPELQEVPEFTGKLHGHGETAWIREGLIVATTWIASSPKAFETSARELLAVATPPMEPKEP